jgi:pyruvate/2-oxoglutarate dehydrogenase complex dihydrolipoamide dehydrogenase (E3) component
VQGFKPKNFGKMAADYDLVVIGSSWEGIYAAKTAVMLQARVALVTQGNTYLPNDTLFNRSLSEVGRLNYRLANDPFANGSPMDLSSFTFKQGVNWTKEISWVERANNSLASLAALGVDVIVGLGEFCRLPQLGFNVANRKLISRNYLLATGANFKPDLDINPQDYLTLRQLGKRADDLKREVIVIGSDPTSLELAQTLARLDKQVTLVVQQPRILPHEDPDIAMFIQAQLEAEGIKIYTNSPVTQIKTINEHKWLQAGDIALSADEVIFADYRQPNITSLNLAGVNVKHNHRRIIVNRKLQTTNPNIYACGDLIGGYALPNITQYEVNLILKNSLFLPWYKTNYHTLPWAIFTQPSLARVGLTQHQARHQFGGDIYIIKQYFHNVAEAQILESTSGLCKLIVRENGEILGCSIVGDRAVELIATVALMIQHKIGLDRNPMRGLTSMSIPTVYPSMAEILERSSQNFYQQKLQRNPKLLNRLRSWFSIRRSWHK